MLALSVLLPLSARGQFVTLLDTTTRYAGGNTGSPVFNGDTGTATAVDLSVPTSVVMDSFGNLYVSDTLNNCVRKVTPSGAISTVAGLRVNAQTTDTCNPATGTASDPTLGLLAPTGLAIDSNNTLYIADTTHHCVRSLAYNTVDSAVNPSVLTTVAGTCTSEYYSSATPVPIGLAVDSNSNLYISLALSQGGNVVNQVVRHAASDPAGTICAVAGQLSSYSYGAQTLCSGVTGTVDLNRPAGLAFDKNENLYIADSSDDCVREIVGLTTQHTAVGQCVNDHTGSASTALNNPYGLSFSADGLLFISESGTTAPVQNNLVSFNYGTGILSAIAGLSSGTAGAYNLSQEGQSALLVPLNQPLGVTTDVGGNVYLADSQNNVVRKLSTNTSFPDTNVGATSLSQTLIFSINQSVNLTATIGVDFNIVSNTCLGALTAAPASQPPNTCQVVVTFSPTRPGERYAALTLVDSISGNQIGVALEGLGIGPLSLLTPGVASTHGSGLHNAVAVTTDTAGDVYVLEQGNGSTTADVLFYPAAGGAAQVKVAQGAGLLAPTALAVDGSGNIYVANSSAILGGNTSIARFGADGSVNLNYATGLLYVNSLAVDGFGDLFVAMGGSVHNVTEIYAGGQRSVVMGSGSNTPTNGLLATSASLSDPSAVAVGPNGVTIADAGAHLVYTIDDTGFIHIVAGNGTTSTSAAGVATGTGLNLPDGLAVDAAGDIYIADSAADLVYEVYAASSNGVNIASIIGTGVTGDTGDNGPSPLATLAGPVGIALDGSADLFVVDSGNNALREVSYPTISTINFGNVAVGGSSIVIEQSLTNAGNATLALTTPFTTTDVHYAVALPQTSCTNSTLPGVVCQIGYTYTPTATGSAPAGQSNLPSNSYNTVQVVNFAAYGYSSGQGLPYALTNPENEVYGSPFVESLQLSLSAPFVQPHGSMVFSVAALTTCTISGPFASGAVNCNAPNSGLGVGSYTVNFSYTSSNTDYLSASGTTTLNVSPALLTFNVGTFTRAYGAANPVFAPQVINGVNGDTFTVNYQTTATATSAVGAYPVTATLTPVGSASLSNYTVTINSGTLNVTAAPLSIVVDSDTRQYGTANPTLTGTVGSTANGDILTVTYTTTATIASPVGSYPITVLSVAGAQASNYAPQVTPGTLKVTAYTALVSVTVGNATRAYGTPNPSFTNSVVGALNGDTFTITDSTLATITSSVTAPGNPYAIDAVVSGAATANYSNIQVTAGALTITPTATPLVIKVISVTRPYGVANPTFTDSVTGALNSDTFTVSYTTAATAASDVGVYPVTALATSANIGNYSNVTYTAGSLSILPAATVTTVTTGAAANQGTSLVFTATVTYGASLPVAFGTGLPTPAATVNFCTTATTPCTSASANYLGSGTLNALGVATFSTSTMTAGTYTITASYQTSSDFVSSSGSAQQIINPGTFTLTATPANQFIRGSGITSYAVTVNSVQGFEGPVALTCAGLPSDASCSFASPTVTLTIGGSASTTMTVVNTNADAKLSMPRIGLPKGRTPSGLSPIDFAAVFPFGVGACLASLARRRNNRRTGEKPRRSSQIRLLLALLCTVGVLSVVGCSCLTSVYNVYTIPVTGTDTTGTIVQTTGTSPNSASPTLTVAQQQ